MRPLQSVAHIQMLNNDPNQPVTDVAEETTAEATETVATDTAPAPEAAEGGE
jgi:hypothetical protein